MANFQNFLTAFGLCFVEVVKSCPEDLAFRRLWESGALQGGLGVYSLVKMASASDDPYSFEPVLARRPLPGRCLAAMIALLPLPGSPRYRGDDAAILGQALEDALHFRSAGVDALLIENSHDLPYIKPPLHPRALEVVGEVAQTLRREFEGPIGLQLLEAANLDALRLAAAADLDFLRVEAFVFAHIGGAGLIEGCAGHLLRLRRELRCEHIRIFGDVHKKHCAHGLTADLDIVDEVRQAEFFLVDGVIVTGPRTGAQPVPKDLARVKDCAQVPVWIGSGMTPDNLATYFALADGFIVGSTFRRGGQYLEKLDPQRLRRFVDKLNELREAEA